MSADMFGGLSPSIYRFVLGEMEVTCLLDGAVTMGVSPPFLLDETDAEISRIAQGAHLPDDKLENNFVPVVVNTGGTLVLIDTGLGGGKRAAGAGFLSARLAEAGYAAKDIDIVMLTHVHPDHIGGLWEDGALAFPNAQHMIGQREYEAWKSGDDIPPQRAENREMFLKLVVPLEDRLQFLSDGDAIAPGLSAVAAFGHSPGHMMVRLESAGRTALIWADLANHHVFSVAHPGSKVGFDDDKPQAIATRKRVLEELAKSGDLVIGHHMPFPGTGFVERDGSSYRWVPVSYQLRL